MKHVYSILLGFALWCAAAQAQDQKLFSAQGPAQINNSDGASLNYELGMKFTATSNGQIKAIRFYKDNKETGTHIGKIYSASGQQLASVTFAGETASGWQQQTLSSPLSISANTEYTVTVNTGGTYYVATVNGFASQIASGNLKSVVGNNGVFGPVGSRPTQSWNWSNYFRDVIFIADQTQQAPAPSAALKVGDLIKAIRRVNVRASASLSGQLLGTRPRGTLGKIVAGPISADGVTWLKIDYDSGVDGYSGADNLAAVSSSPAPAPAPAPAPSPTLDGSANAPNCIVQRPTLLSGYLKRPAWKVAGVDYCVGYPATITLKSPTSISMSGVSVDSNSKVVHVTGNGITLNGYDFSNWWVYLEGANQSVVNSKFANSGVIGMQSSSNIYVGYSVIDGGAVTNGLVEMRGGGTVTVEYSWLKNSGGDILQMHCNRSSTLIARYNLIENAGMAPGAHGDYTEFIGNYSTSLTYNTTYQGGVGTTQGFMVEPDFGSSAGTIFGGEISNNTMVTKGGLSYFTAMTVPDLTATFKVNDNYFDANAGYGFAIGGVRGGPGDGNPFSVYTNNVNMNNGALVKD